MKELPILFSTPMIHALQAGRKTQTRRVVSSRNSLFDGRGFHKGVFEELDFNDAFVDQGPSPAGNPGPYLKVARPSWTTRHRIYPKYQPGDQLWVRETFLHNGCYYEYKAGPKKSDPPYKWKPSIFMPRNASRIQLEITGIRVEHLQDISEADAIAEGIEVVPQRTVSEGDYSATFPLEYRIDIDGLPLAYSTAKEAYSVLWCSINGPQAWENNPWVYVIEFKIIK